MTSQINKLKRELRGLQERRKVNENVKELKSQIRKEKMMQSTTFNFLKGTGHVVGVVAKRTGGAIKHLPKLKVDESKMTPTARKILLGGLPVMSNKERNKLMFNS